MNVAEQLEQSPLFKGVPLADREALVSVMHRQSCPLGTILFERESVGNSVYIILSGRIRIYTYDGHDEDSREFTIRHYGQSQLFGEFSMLDQKPRSASAAAAEDSEVLVLHRDDFLAFLQERPFVGLSMMQNLVERVRYTTTYLQRVMDATQRLSQGEYDQIAQDFLTSGSDSEIEKLLDAFVQMVRSVQSREETLKHEIQPGQAAP